MFEEHALRKEIAYVVKAKSPLSICSCWSLLLGQVNLGDAVLRGLFSKWIEQHFRLNGRTGTCRQHRRSGRSGSSGSGNVNFSGNGIGEGRHADNESPYSSGDESDSDESYQGDGWEYESSLTSPVSRESSQASAKDGGVRLAGSGSTRPSHGLDGDLSGGDGDGDGCREGIGGQTGSARAIRDDTVVLVTESEISGNEGMQRTLLQKRVCEFDGTEVCNGDAWVKRGGAVYSPVMRHFGGSASLLSGRSSLRSLFIAGEWARLFDVLPYVLFTTPPSVNCFTICTPSQCYIPLCRVSFLCNAPIRNEMACLISRNMNQTYSQGGDVIPQWVTACVIHGKFNVREQTKVTFYLAPWVPPDPAVPSATPRQHEQNHVVRGGVPGTGRGEGSGRSATTGSQLKPERFKAPAQMPISKVCVCVCLLNYT